MKSKLYFVSIFLSLFFLITERTNAQAPDWLWAKAIGGIGDDFGSSLALDPTGSGDVYATGTFQNTVDFNPGSGVFNLISAGDDDIFISKSDEAGNFIWAKRIGGTGNDGTRTIALDASGNVYTTGHFSGTVDFDPGSGTFNLTSNVSGSIFISKLDALGNFVWAKAMGGAGSASCMALDSAESWDIYISGYFQQTGDFDPGAGTFNLTAPENGGIFIMKLDSSGNFVWAFAMGGADGAGIFSMALDPAGSGDVYTTGIFAGTADFDPDSSEVINLTSAGGTDIFVSKLDGSGNFVWAKRMGAGSDEDSYAIATDPKGSGDVYTTGYFEGTVDFDPDSSATFNLTSAGYKEMFISKLDSSGNFVWAKAIGGITSEGIGNSIAVDPGGSGDIYITGAFEGTVDFDPGVDTFNLTSETNFYDFFISRLDSGGNFVWTKATGGTYRDFGTSLALGSNGEVYVQGYFTSHSISFDSTTFTNVDNGGTMGNIFITQLDFATGNEIVENRTATSVYPNPASNHFTIASGGPNKKLEVTITDISGKIIYRTTAAETQKLEVNIKGFAEGVYVVQIQAADFMETKKLIIAK